MANIQDIKAREILDSRGNPTIECDIILSDNSYFHSKPELKIYADDVKCSHGSTIGPFDEEEIFYLRTRGLNIKAARTLLIRAFCYDFLRSIGEDSYVKEVNELINEWLLEYLH